MRRKALLATVIDSELGRFSVHAGTTVTADDRPALLRLLRYAARPPLSRDHLSITASGKVCYKLKKPYYTGQSEVVLEARDQTRYCKRPGRLLECSRDGETLRRGALRAEPEQSREGARIGASCQLGAGGG